MRSALKTSLASLIALAILAPAAPARPAMGPVTAHGHASSHALPVRSLNGGAKRELPVVFDPSMPHSPPVGTPVESTPLMAAGGGSVDVLALALGGSALVLALAGIAAGSRRLARGTHRPA